MGKLRGFSTPDEIARFKSVEWVIGYVLGMGNPVTKGFRIHRFRVSLWMLGLEMKGSGGFRV